MDGLDTAAIDSLRAPHVRSRWHRDKGIDRRENVEVEAFYWPGSDAPPEHIYPRQEEYFEVQAGNIETRVNGQKKGMKQAKAFVFLRHRTSNVEWRQHGGTSPLANATCFAHR
jgi:hypothetical protein